MIQPTSLVSTQPLPTGEALFVFKRQDYQISVISHAEQRRQILLTDSRRNAADLDMLYYTLFLVGRIDWRIIEEAFDQIAPLNRDGLNRLQQRLPKEYAKSTWCFDNKEAYHALLESGTGIQQSICDNVQEVRLDQIPYVGSIASMRDAFAGTDVPLMSVWGRVGDVARGGMDPSVDVVGIYCPAETIYVSHRRIKALFWNAGAFSNRQLAEDVFDDIVEFLWVPHS